MGQKTALIDAVKEIDISTVEAILDREPSLLSTADRDGRNLLHIACGVPTFKTMKRDRFNEDYRRIAARRGPNAGPRAQVRLSNALIERGVPVDEPFGRDKCTPLFEAVARARNLALVKSLLGHGADVRRAPGGGLFAATWWQDLDVLGVLLDAGAEIDVVVGVTPFLASWCTE